MYLKGPAFHRCIFFHLMLISVTFLNRDYRLQDNKDVWKLVLGKHNLTSPISSYSRPEVITKSQTYFFTHTVKTIAVTSTAKGITSKQLLIGTIGDQVRSNKKYVRLMCFCFRLLALHCFCDLDSLCCDVLGTFSCTRTDSSLLFFYRFWLLISVS